MTKHRQSSFALTLATVAAFMATTLASSAVTAEPAKTLQELSAKGPVYTVFRNEAGSSDHEAAIIAVVQTSSPPGPANHSLVFLQTDGLGMVCEHADPRPSDANRQGDDKAPSDKALECHQHVGDIKEILRVGALDSEFCNELRGEIAAAVQRDSKLANKLYTETDKKNPIVTKGECEDEMGKNGHCLCYAIVHEGVQDFPPSSGTGSGGHN